MNYLRWFQFRLRDIGWLTVVVALVLALMLNHWRHRQSFSAMIQRFEREVPWVKWESNEPDWREAALRPDQYRVNVRRVVDDSDQLVAVLTIETLSPQWFEISSHGKTWVGPSSGHTNSGTVDFKGPPEGNYTATSTLSATQVRFQKKQVAQRALGGGMTTMEVPLQTPLNRVLEITAKDGIYPLHTPIVIGNAFGVDVKLTVGERTKVEAISRTFTASLVANGETNEDQPVRPGKTARISDSE